LASGVSAPQSLDVPVHTQLAQIAIGSDVQPSLTFTVALLTASIDTQLSLAHAVAPPSAFADVLVLSTVAPTSECTITAVTTKQEDELGRGAVVNTVTSATQSVNQTSAVSHSSNAASSANPALPTSVVFKQLTAVHL